MPRAKRPLAPKKGANPKKIIKPIIEKEQGATVLEIETPEKPATPLSRRSTKLGQKRSTPPPTPTPGTVSSPDQHFQQIGAVTPKTRNPGRLKKRKSLFVALWAEETHLYDSTHKHYRNTMLRQEIFRRFAVVLAINADEVERHTKTLRTAYGKLAFIPSGSAADRLTARQQQIIMLCGFLRCHIRSREGLSNLARRASPAKARTLMTHAAAQELKRGGTSFLLPVSVPPKGVTGNISEEEEDTSFADQMPGTSKPTKMNLQSVFDKESEIGDGESASFVDDASVTSFPRTKKRKNAESSDSSRLLQELTTSVSSLARSACDKKKVVEDDRHSLWSRLLTGKLHQMEAKTAERFKLHVDTINSPRCD